MARSSAAAQGSGAHRGATVPGPADVAYRRAWWSLVLYPVALVVAFGIGEGLSTTLTDDAGDPAFWEVLVAGLPALTVLVIPGVLAVLQGRQAMRLGRTDGKVPAIVGGVIAVAFVGPNVLSYLVGSLVG